MKVFGKLVLTAVAVVLILVGLCCIGGEVSKYWMEHSG